MSQNGNDAYQSLMVLGLELGRGPLSDAKWKPLQYEAMISYQTKTVYGLSFIWKTNFRTENMVQREKRRSKTQMMAASAVFWAGVFGLGARVVNKNALEPSSHFRGGCTSVNPCEAGLKESGKPSSHLSPAYRRGIGQLHLWIQRFPKSLREPRESVRVIENDMKSFRKKNIVYTFNAYRQTSS